MACYIINGKDGVNPDEVTSIGGIIIDTIPCTNCLVVSLNETQVILLREMGYVVTIDRTCSL